MNKKSKKIFIEKAERKIKFLKGKIVYYLKNNNIKKTRYFSKLLFILRDKTLELYISKRS